MEAEENHCLKLYADGTMREICAALPFAKLGMLSFEIYGLLPGLWPLIPESPD